MCLQHTEEGPRPKVKSTAFLTRQNTESAKPSVSKLVKTLFKEGRSS